MKKNYAPIFLVAFAMAAICTAVFYSLIAGRLAPSAQASAGPKILVAARPISRGATVATQDLELAAWSGPVPDGALRQVSQASGLTATAAIGPGEAVTESRLAGKGAGGGLGVPSGMRGISVQVHDSSGVVALLKPGHRVDVQAVYTRSGAVQDSEIRTVLENIEVLKINPTPEPAPGRPALPVATLLATPAEADTLGLADAVARVRLVLRNPLDQEKLPRGAMSAAGLMRGGAPLPAFHAAPARTAPSAPPLVSPATTARVSSAISLAATGGAQPSCEPAQPKKE